MNHLVLTCVVIPLVSACITSSSNGTTSDGKPVHLEVQGGLTKQVTLTFEGPVVCSGKYSGSAVGQQKTFPLTCSDGASGTATMFAKSVDLVTTGTVTYSMSDGVSGSVTSKLGETTVSEQEQRADLDRQTCVQTNVSGKAVLAFAMRINGVSREKARQQLGAATHGTVGYAVREAALDAAYSLDTETAKEAQFSGFVKCIQRLSAG